MGVYNLNNHTPFSDGAFEIDELCAAHMALQDIRVDGIGVSDQLFCTPSSVAPRDDRDFERIFGAETRRYVETVLAARERWAGRLRVFVGCKIDWARNKARLDTIREKFASPFDYVLFECVDWAGLTTLANQARRWPCPIGLADTDVAERYPSTSMDQVVRTLANARICYELNARRLPIPASDRWMTLLPQHRVTVSLGTDTRDDLTCLESIGDLTRAIDRHGLRPRLWAPREVAADTEATPMRAR